MTALSSTAMLEEAPVRFRKPKLLRCWTVPASEDDAPLATDDDDWDDSGPFQPEPIRTPDGQTIPAFRIIDDEFEWQRYWFSEDSKRQQYVSLRKAVTHSILPRGPKSLLLAIFDYDRREEPLTEASLVRQLDISKRTLQRYKLALRCFDIEIKPYMTRNGRLFLNRRPDIDTFARLRYYNDDRVACRVCGAALDKPCSDSHVLASQMFAISEQFPMPILFTPNYLENLLKLFPLSEIKRATADLESIWAPNRRFLIRPKLVWSHVINHSNSYALIAEPDRDLLAELQSHAKSRQENDERVRALLVNLGFKLGHLWKRQNVATDGTPFQEPCSKVPERGSHLNGMRFPQIIRRERTEV
jgi:hypothetical protein